jgi:hypothetical protein
MASGSSGWYAAVSATGSSYPVKAAVAGRVVSSPIRATVARRREDTHMADETAAERYARLEKAYRKLVSDYRREVRRAFNYLEFFLTDWSRVATGTEPRCGLPLAGFDADDPNEEVVPSLAPWDASRVITAERLLHWLTTLSAAWDELNDAYDRLSEAEKTTAPPPTEIHAAATAHTPMTSDDQ